MPATVAKTLKHAASASCVAARFSARMRPMCVVRCGVLYRVRGGRFAGGGVGGDEFSVGGGGEAALEQAMNNVANVDDATNHLRCWIRDFGKLKEPTFIADLTAVLDENDRLRRELADMKDIANRDLVEWVSSSVHSEMPPR